NLDWDDFRPLMERYLSNLPIQVHIHDYEVDIGLPEHIQSSSLQRIRFERSFPKFITDISSVIYAAKGQFYDLSGKMPYSAKIVSDGDLKVERDVRVGTIPKDELFELWTLMLPGPISRRKLAGRAHADAYYLFPVLSGLPYVRAIELQPRGSAVPAIA